MNVVHNVILSGLNYEIRAPDICSCLKCKVGICMFRYFRVRKWLQNPRANVSRFPREQEADNFTHDGMIIERQVCVSQMDVRFKIKKKKERKEKNPLLMLWLTFLARWVTQMCEERNTMTYDSQQKWLIIHKDVAINSKQNGKCGNNLLSEHQHDHPNL